MKVKKNSFLNQICILFHLGHQRTEEVLPTWIFQCPMWLNWKTIHKAQGATIIRGVIDLNFGSFRPESGVYVGVSRFPTSSSFILLDYRKESFTFSSKALAEIDRLKGLPNGHIKLQFRYSCTYGRIFSLWNFIRKIRRLKRPICSAVSNICKCNAKIKICICTVIYSMTI